MRLRAIVARRKTRWSTGENWTTIPAGPGRVTVLALDPQYPDTVYAGGQGGLFAIGFAPAQVLTQGVLWSHIYE